MPGERSSFIKEKHLKYLSTLRETGITNMYGARPWLKNAFPALSDDQAAKVLLYWIEKKAN